MHQIRFRLGLCPHTTPTDTGCERALLTTAVPVQLVPSLGKIRTHCLTQLPQQQFYTAVCFGQIINTSVQNHTENKLQNVKFCHIMF